MVDTVGDTLAKTEAETLDDTVGDVEAKALGKTLKNTRPAKRAETH